MSVYKRGPVWWVRFQWRGQEIRQSSRSTLRREAEAFERTLRQRLAAIDRGGRPRRTYDEMMTRFFEEHLPTMKPGASRRYIVSARSLNPHFRDRYLDELTKGSIADFVSARRREVTDATIRRDLACLSSALTCAVRWDWIDHNVMRSLDKRSIKESRPRIRWLTAKEYAAIRAKASSAMMPVVTLLVETGMRMGELLSLEWRDVNLDRREIYLHGPRTKTGTARTVPLSDEAIAALRSLPRHLTCPLVLFTRTGKGYLVTGMSHRLQRLHAKAGVKDFRAHDYRHTFASWYLQRGGRIERLQAILGHSRIMQTTKYAHLATQDLHDDMQRVGTYVGTDATDLAQRGPRKGGAK